MRILEAEEMVRVGVESQECGFHIKENKLLNYKVKQ
jgi:hypothetical protein